MAKLIIDNGWADMDYVEKYTYGFEQYKALADQYSLDKVAQITGLDPDDIYEATKLYATNGPACTNFSASALVHHINGFNSYRAIFCLTALTGNFDRAGGNVPNPATYLHKPAGFKMREHEFRSDRYPGGVERIGAERFPLWNAQFDELQGMDLLRQLEEDKPYPVRAIFALGMNAKMYPQTDDLLRAMKDKLDFFVDTDVYMTMTAKYADIVLPACTSVERSELKAYQGGYLFYTKPAIQPLYESRSDVDILCDLARLMNLDDEYLQKGYEASLDWMMEGCGLTVADQNDEQTRENYPFYLCTGARLAHAIHSRAHETPWLRSLRPEPTCEINPEDGKRLGLKEGGSVELYSPYGSIRVKVKYTHKIKPGVIMMLHGYTEANVNLLIGRDHLDPYSGFPGFKGMRCNIRNVQEG